MSTANGTTPTAVTCKDLFVACINLKWPETGDQEAAMAKILDHPKIKRKIEFESKKFSDMNSELDQEELYQEIQTLLYLAIKNEFTTTRDLDRIEGWLCSRIAWRSLDHVSKECDLVYAKDEETGEPEYKRVEKISLDRSLMTTVDLKRTGTVTANSGIRLDTTVAFGNQMPANVERHPTFESFLRKAPIKIQHKHILMYVVIMSYNFREVADMYQISSPTARKMYKKAVESMKRYISTLSVAEQSSVQNLLRGLHERQ